MLIPPSSRRDRDDLLVRPPSGFGPVGIGSAVLIIDPVAQVGELADLLERGLLSREEYERLKQRVV
jgi:hypothetical protein